MNRIRLPKLILIIFLFIILLYLSFKPVNINKEKVTKSNKNEPKIVETKKKEEKKEISEQNENEEQITEDTTEEQEPVTEEPVSPPIVQENYQYYRLTSYWSGDEYDTGGCTGSGLCEKDFQVNDRGWYTYNGYLVLAGATTYLQSRYGTREGRHYFKYYETVNLEIDGVSYQGIILDSCGASMYMDEERLDLFVANSSGKIDRGYGGNNMVKATFN